MNRIAWSVVALAACNSPAHGPSPVKPVAPAVDHELHVSLTTVGKTLHATVTGHEVVLEHLPLAAWLQSPMAGQGEIAIDVTVAIEHGRPDYRGANGTIDLRCVGKCRLGDEHTKLHVAPAMSGLDVDLDELESHAAIANGQLTVSRWTVRAQDVEVSVSGRIELAAELDDSVLAGCVRIKASGELATLLGPIASDGMHNIRIAGHVGDMHRLDEICDGSVPIRPDLEPPHDKPSLTVTPPRDDATPDLDAIRELKPNTYEIAKDLLDQLLADPMVLAKGARMVPNVKDGKAAGFKLYAIRPTSVLAHLGFQNGDTLLTVNGWDLTTADKALEIYTKLRDATQIEIGIERRHQPLTLTYSIR